MSESAKTIYDRMEDASTAEAELEELLEEALVLYKRTGWDSYDQSYELYGVPVDFRLSDAQQQIFITAGFLQVYVNHDDKWETHYRWPEKEPVAGWRVSYPHKRGEKDGKIMVEKVVTSWPSEWFETGYVLVRPREQQATEPAHE